MAELNLSISATSNLSDVSLTQECHKDQSLDLFCTYFALLMFFGRGGIGVQQCADDTQALQDQRSI